MPEIPLAEIHDEPPGAGLRRIGAGAQADAGLRQSIEDHNVLVPVLLMPRPEGGYSVLDGRRRIAVARGLGMLMIPAELRQPTDTVPAAAIEAATNMVRAQMHPVDQWRAVSHLMTKHGFTVAGAARSLGLTEREAKRMRLLAKVHPPILEAMARATGQDAQDIFGPDSDTLSSIAMAPADVQAAAWDKLKDKDSPNWYLLCNACSTREYLKADAEFDDAIAAECGIEWMEDLFAEPRKDGEPDLFTPDGAAFRKAQKLWIERVKIPAMTAQGYQASIGKAGKYGGIETLPNHEVVGGNPDKAAKTVVRIYSIDDYSGRVIVSLQKRLKGAEPEPEAAPAEPASGTPAAKGKDKAPRAPGPGAPAPAAPQDPPKPVKVLTKKGHALVAKVKTDALHAWLNSGDGTLDSLRLLRALVVALAGGNVSISTSGEVSYQRSRQMFEDLAARLVGPDGAPLHVDADTLLDTAAEAIARIVFFDPHGEDHGGSGSAAAWVSRIVNCPYPRFDTPEILAETSTATLRELADWQKLNSARPKEALLRDLAGAVPGWKPPGVVFDGAPGPARDDGEGEEREAA